MRVTATPLAVVFGVMLSASPASFPAESPSRDPASAGEMMRLGLRGVYFVPNEGQWSDESVIYGFRSRGLDVTFRESALTLHLRREKKENDPSAHKPGRSAAMRSIAPGFPNRDTSRLGSPRRPGFDGEEIRGCEDSTAAWESLVPEVTFPGSNAVTPRGAKPQAAKFNYYIGDDKSKWRSDVPSFGAVIYENLYDGIDLHVMGSGGGVLKYEFHCEPGSDHSQIRIHYDGIHSLRIDERGDLLIETSFGTLRDTAPVVWQPHSGTGILPVRDDATNIPARFQALDANTYTITLLTEPDPSLPLIIDPEIDWMYYLGGRDDDVGFGVATDSASNALVTGYTRSPDFEGRSNSYHGGPWDAFLLKVSPSGVLQWMTYLGGNDWERGWGVATDSARNALVTGHTYSTNFGGRTNSFHGGEVDAFVLKVSSSGALQWMIYLGGGAQDYGTGVATDSAGNALVTGETGSADFEGRSNTIHGSGDAFLVKVSLSGVLQWMNYLGGSQGDSGWSVATDSAGNALVTGRTASSDFEGRSNSYHGGAWDAFLLKVSPSGTLQWMNYFGGSSPDLGQGVTTDSAGNALVAGDTSSIDFEGRNNSHYGGSNDAFAIKVSPSGELQWMTYLGGSDADLGQGVATDSVGNALVTGYTVSNDFEGRTNSFHGGNIDAFLLTVSPSGTLQWMTYLGGSRNDNGLGVATDSAGNVLVTGYTVSTDFEGRSNSHHENTESFLLKVGLAEGVAATLTALDIRDGIIISGGLPELEDSDDAYLETEARVTGEAAQPHLLRLHVIAVTDVQDASRFRLTTEARITDFEAQTTLRLRDWINGGFVQVDQFLMGMTEKSRETNVPDVGNFIHPTTGRIRLEIKQIVFLPFTLNGFHTLFDQVEIAVR